MCGISIPLFDGYESACTTFVATFPRVRPTGDKLTVFYISVKAG